MKIEWRRTKGSNKVSHPRWEIVQDVVYYNINHEGLGSAKAELESKLTEIQT